MRCLPSRGGFRKANYLSIFPLQIGKTKVFLRAGQMAELDSRRTVVLGRSASIIQKKFRSHMARRNFTLLRQLAIRIQSMCRGTSFATCSAFSYLVLRLKIYQFFHLSLLQESFLGVYTRACGKKQLV